MLACVSPSTLCACVCAVVCLCLCLCHAGPCGLVSVCAWACISIYECPRVLALVSLLILVHLHVYVFGVWVLARPCGLVILSACVCVCAGACVTAIRDPRFARNLPQMRRRPRRPPATLDSLGKHCRLKLPIRRSFAAHVDRHGSHFMVAYSCFYVRRCPRHQHAWRPGGICHSRPTT